MENEQVGEPPAPDAGPEAEPAIAHPTIIDLSPLFERLERIERRQDEVAGQVERVVEHARLHGRSLELADRLYEEVQTLRRGELASAQAPLVRDVIRLADDIQRMGDSEDLRIVGSQVLQVLQRSGVEPFGAEVGDAFDATLHNGVGRQPTADETLDRTVAKVVKAGFRRDDGSLVRPVDVEVHQYKPQPAPAADQVTEPDASPADLPAAEPHPVAVHDVPDVPQEETQPIPTHPPAEHPEPTIERSE